MTRHGIGWGTAATAAVLAAALMLGAPFLTGGSDSTAFAQDGAGREPGSTRSFAKFDGIDGELKDENHDKWIDVLSIDWGVTRSGRRRARAAALTLTVEYEKAAIALLSRSLGQGTNPTVSNLEIEQTATYGGVRSAYLKYTLKNVIVTSYDFKGRGSGEAPIVVFTLGFEEIKVTYTEFDDAGDPVGDTSAEFRNRRR